MEGFGGMRGDNKNAVESFQVKYLEEVEETDEMLAAVDEGIRSIEEQGPRTSAPRFAGKVGTEMMLEQNSERAYPDRRNRRKDFC
jgi:hypothetical protein